MSHLTPSELRQVLSKLPRVTLGHLPTPLELLPRFSKQVGGPQFYIKRDDCTGLAMGGNKTRHNEFLFGAALKQNADVLVWGAGAQSNNCRQTAAACAKLGLECQLFLSRVDFKEDIQGNLLLDYLFGAKVQFVDVPVGPGLDQLLLDKADELRKAGRRPFVWDRVTGRPLAAASYVLCFVELMEQIQSQGIDAKVLYASAAGATGAGLLLGKTVLGWPGRVKLFCPIQWPWNVPADLAEVANQTAELLGLPHRVQAADVDVDLGTIGPSYGTVTAESRQAIRTLAQTEGILLDPIYTGKALGGVLEDVRFGRLTPSDTTIFLHTGGTPALFAYRDALL